jgi:hypothetical protein
MLKRITVEHLTTGMFLHHIEQVGWGDGHIEFGAERFEIRNALTNRDHSRCVRFVDKFRRHCEALGHFADDDITFSVYAIEMCGIEGHAISNASVTRSGWHYPAEVTNIELIDGSADGCRPFRFAITSELGEMVINKSAHNHQFANVHDQFLGFASWLRSQRAVGTE